MILHLHRPGPPLDRFIELVTYYAGYDPDHTKEKLLPDGAVEIIVEMNDRAAIVVVEHDMHFIRQLAKTVTVLHQGRILTEGHVDAVLGDPLVRDVYLGKSQ